MATLDQSTIEPVELQRRNLRGILLCAKSGIYILLLLVAALGSGIHGLKKYGILSCTASGYGSDSYLGYCGAKGYGDYDHGAIWFGLEPEAVKAAADAQVLFLGNSRTVFGFSSKATNDWFSSLRGTYYLLGFSHFENFTFEEPLLRRLHPKAKVYVINIDSFFEQTETGPGKTVMRDESAGSHYAEKRRWQSVHKLACTSFKSLCGNDEAIFRSRSTGSWMVFGDRFSGAPVSYSDSVDQNKVASYTALGREFLHSLPSGNACTILTMVPNMNTDLGTANAIASGMGVKFVAPRLDGLETYDHVHLNPESAQRWSAAFFKEAGPQIRNCLSK
jgi:hypothetical protein